MYVVSLAEMGSVKSDSLSRSRQQRRDPERTRQDLLDAAWPIFAEKGFAAASVEDICRAAGLTRGAFYWHFTSKEDLLISAFEARRARLNQKTARRTTEMTTREGVLQAAEEEVTDPDVEEWRTWMLLSFETLLYAARNPEAQERLAGLKRSAMEVIAERARLWSDQLVLSVEDVTALFQAVNDGLAIQDLYFDENQATQRYRRLLPVLLSAVVGEAYDPEDPGAASTEA
jgi:AcrR family transcriptional regulator